MNMGTPAGEGRSIRWSLRTAFGEQEGVRHYKKFRRDLARYRGLLYQEEFYQAHAERLILFQGGKVLAESDNFDALVEDFLPKAAAGCYLICHVARYSPHQPYPYHPVPWIFVGWDHDLSEEKVETLIRENSRWVWQVF